MRPTPNTKSNSTEETKSKFSFTFGKKNYILLIAGIVVLVIGYLCLIGGGSDDPNVFNENIFNVQRLVIAPLLIVAGLIIEVFAIMIRSKE